LGLRTVSRDNLPHKVDGLIHNAAQFWYTLVANLMAYWWGIDLGDNCTFFGYAKFWRHPISKIRIAKECRFRSGPTSNLIGVNRPCILSTLTQKANLEIGSRCGFSGTVIGCASHIVLEDGVRCGANTLITDTDWHFDDNRAGPDAPVHICQNVWLGVNVTILKGVTIGENTVIAAGSIVTHSLPPNVVAGGVPAVVLRELDPEPQQNDN
jgi:hypothetical protein